MTIKKIWVDADACPVIIKEILYRAAERKKILTTFVSNQALSVPNSAYIKTFQVQAGFDVADNEIVHRCNKEDLVITSDIPLAADIIKKEASALSPRGELFTSENIQQRLQMRDFLDSLRGSGIQSGGPAPMTQKERQDFANKLDQFLQSSSFK